MKIEGSVAVVTGAASGLGLATAKAFHEAGASIGAIDLRMTDLDAATATLGSRCMPVAADVTDEDSIKSALAAIAEKFGSVAVCVNCAGIGPAGRTVGRDGPYPLSAFRHTVDVNLVGTFNVCRLVASLMAMNDGGTDDGERGAIINTSSIAAFEGQTGQVAYSASKAGIVGMTLPLARDLARFGIRVNCIAPGIMDTRLLDAVPEAVQNSLLESVLFPKRPGHPSEFAEIVKTIVKCSYINAEVIRLDGGLRMHER